MAKITIYAEYSKVYDICTWLDEPNLDKVPFEKGSIMTEPQEGYSPITVNANEYRLLVECLLHQDVSYKKETIDRSKVLTHYLKRIGANPKMTYSLGAQAIDEVLQIGIDIIEENYKISEK